MGAFEKLTPERLRVLVVYDPETGLFTWRSAAGRWGRIPAGSPCGYQGTSDRYTHHWIDGVQYQGHTLAWFYVYGERAKEIDHINCIKNDNRIANLRSAQSFENKANMRRPVHNTSGFKGASFHKAVNRWRAVIQVRGKAIHLGYFVGPAEAHAAYVAAAREKFGEFARAD